MLPVPTMNCPLGITLLLNSAELTMRPGFPFFRTEYTVTSSQVPGSSLKIRGILDFKVKDYQDVTIALFEQSYIMFSVSDIKVTLGKLPPLTVKNRNAFSRTICIFEDGRPVLKIKRPLTFGWTNEYIILGENNAAVGLVRKDCRQYVVRCPLDLDVRYKAALLAVCLYVLVAFSEVGRTLHTQLLQNRLDRRSTSPYSEWDTKS